MLLTLTLSSPAVARSLSTRGLAEVPKVVRDEYGLSGLNVSTSLLKGADRATLTNFRDAADRAGCACLVLVEPPINLAATTPKRGDQAEDRIMRLIEAAGLLGCNSLALGIAGPDSEEAFDMAVERLRLAAEKAERRELNILISPTEGLTEDPDRVSELIKKVGGFRIGTYPDFETASKTADPIAYLRRLAPYAWAVSASTIDFIEPENKPEEAAAAESTGDEELDALLEELVDPPKHVPYDIDAMVAAIASVGYDGTLAIDYRGNAGTLGIRQSCDALEAAMEQTA